MSLDSSCYLKFFKRKKEKKESHRSSGGFKSCQVFLKKYYPIGLVSRTHHNVIKIWNGKGGWRFFQKPGGLELYFLKPELSFTFFLFVFFSSWNGWFLMALLFLGSPCIIGNQTPPSTGAKNKRSDSGDYFLWGAPRRGCGNRTATAGRERIVVPPFAGRSEV